MSPWRTEDFGNPFEQLIEAVPDAMILVDGGGHVLHANEQAAAMFGHPREALLGLGVEDLVPARHRKIHLEHRRAYVAAPHPRPMGQGLELFGVRRDGTEFPVEISLSPLATEQGTLVLAAIRDVTERREAELALRAQSMSRPFVKRVFQAFLDQANLPPNTLVRLGRALVDGSAGASIDVQVEAFRSVGLGELVHDGLDKQGRYLFHGDDLLERRPGAALPTCQLALGFLEGVVRGHTGLQALGAEVQCQSLGHPRCMFVVRAGGRQLHPASQPPST